MTPPPVLLLHGLGSTFDHNWRATGWVDLLEGEGRTVVGVHLPGHGPERERPAADPADLLLDAVSEHDGPVDVVGFSAGGHAVLRAAARQPTAFRRIAVLGVGNPSAPTGETTDTLVRANDLADGLVAEDEPTEPAARLIRRLVDSAGNDRFAVAAFLRATRSRVGPADLARIDGPALVVIGDRDFAGPADQLVAALPQGRLVVLPGVDHFATPSNFGCVDCVVTFVQA